MVDIIHLLGSYDTNQGTTDTCLQAGNILEIRDVSSKGLNGTALKVGMALSTHELEEEQCWTVLIGWTL